MGGLSEAKDGPHPAQPFAVVVWTSPVATDKRRESRSPGTSPNTVHLSTLTQLAKSIRDGFTVHRAPPSYGGIPMARKIDPKKLREMQRSKDPVSTPPPTQPPQGQYPPVEAQPETQPPPDTETDTVYVPVPVPQAETDDSTKKGFNLGFGLAIGCAVGCLVLLAIIFGGPILIAMWTAYGTPIGD